jgi:hypothetical protein
LSICRAPASALKMETSPFSETLASTNEFARRLTPKCYYQTQGMDDCSLLSALCFAVQAGAFQRDESRPRVPTTIKISEI